jgi:5-methylcytosine-specific restriction endonuclease McrA
MPLRSLPKPKRIRLSKRAWELQRVRLWEDNHHCRECGCYLMLEQAIPHHIVFRSQGGGDVDNVLIVCDKCHKALHGIKS